MEITLGQQYNVALLILIRTSDMNSDRRILLYKYNIITSSVLLLLLIYGFTAVSKSKASEVEFGE